MIGARKYVALGLVLLTALIWGVPTAGADEASTIIERCTHGESLVGFSAAAYTKALAELPATVKEYTNCEGLIRAAAPPAPILGRTETLQLLSGTVRVRLKGTNRFVDLSAFAALPDGSEVDATNGRVSITSATPTNETQSAEASGGRFVVHQEHTGTGQTSLTLSQALTGCGQVLRRRRHARSARLAGTSHAVRRTQGPKSRHIWVSDSGGNWRTNGRYVSTTVEGTRWFVLDECRSSLVVVEEGIVKVRDLVRRRTKTVAAGHVYVAAPR
ncbi:MAG TPA: hypothetical protein VMB05_06635 [Solirubrobacteraceae bacterium]|nr:hypothetical protein [Solirubrobacteraceae bacterium]